MHFLLAGSLAIAFALVSSPASALDADSADDVCATNADPCIITEVVHVANQSTLDFGLRTLSMSGNGQFDFGAGNGRVLSGPFKASTDGAAIVAHGPTAYGIESGTVKIIARRSCSVATAPCIDGQDCSLGTCSARRCSLGPHKTCSADSDCNLEQCSATNHHCSLSFRQCSNNTDCSYGACNPELTCSKLGRFTPHVCTVDTDCELGQCTVGEASLELNGEIAGNSNYPASIELQAAGSVIVGGQVEISSRLDINDGGDLTVFSGDGDITIAAKVRAKGGTQGQGGAVDLDAGRDIAVNAPIDANGGDFDGGAVEIDAGRDIAIKASIAASSRGGAGYGGEVFLDAGRDLTIGSAGRSIRVAANGHRDGQNFSGDGGIVDIAAEGNISIEPDVRMFVLGSGPDGYGGDIALAADASITVGGELIARTRGKRGSGGTVVVTALGDITTSDTATLDLRGGDDGGGSAYFESLGGDASIAGRWFTTGSESRATETIFVEACRIRLTGNIDNKTTAATSRLLAHESMQILAGGALRTPGGTNTLVYRTAEKPPVIAGVVTPAPILEIGTLTGCPVCGNLEVDKDEECDDGNVADGDGCDSACLLE